MEIEGASYLYVLVATAMTFVDFSAIVVIIRQMLGASFSPFQTLLMQLLVEYGFIVAFFSLLPMLLALFRLSPVLIWQISSGIVTLVVTVWLSHYLWWRYPAVRSKPQPRYVRFNMLLQTFTLVALLINATGVWYRSQVGPYTVALSWVLLQGPDIFLLSLKSFLRAPRQKAA